MYSTQSIYTNIAGLPSEELIWYRPI